MRYKHRYRWVQMDPETNEAIDIDLQRVIDRCIDINIEVDKDLLDIDRQKETQRQTGIDRQSQAKTDIDRQRQGDRDRYKCGSHRST